MRRRTFAPLVVSACLLLAVVRQAAGGLLTWAHSFVTNQVRTQLAAQSDESDAGQRFGLNSLRRPMIDQ